MKNWKVLIGLLLAFSLIVAACGSDTTDTTEGTTATTAADDGGTTDTTTAADDDGGTTDTTEAEMMGPEATITLWHAWKENEIESLNDVINAFTAIYPDVTVEVLFVPFDDLQNKVTTDWSTGGGPAVLIDAFDRASGYLDADLLYDMDEIISADVISALNPAAVSAVDYDGFKAGLPQTLKGVVLFRNKALAPDPAGSLDDIIGAGASLEQGFFFSMAHLVQACGGEIADADGNPAFNTDAGVCWLETLAQFPNPTYYTDDDIDTFKAGTNAFAIDGTWNLTGFAEAIGAENLAIDPWPTAGTGNLSGVVQPESIYVSNNIDGAELEASVAFVEFFLSTEAQTLLADPTKAGHIPVVAGVEVSDPLLADAVAAFGGGIAQPRFGGCYWGNLDAALQSYFGGDVTAEEALQGAFDIISSAVADEECA